MMSFIGSVLNLIALIFKVYLMRKKCQNRHLKLGVKKGVSLDKLV